MIDNKDRNSKGRVKSFEEHTQPKAEPNSRELRRKAEPKKVKRLKLKK